MSPHAAHGREAILMLYTMLARPSSVLELRVWTGEDGTHKVPLPFGRGTAQKLADRVELYEERYAYEMHLTLPRKQAGWGTADPARILWARITGREQYQRALEFKPLPAMVLQEGASSRRLLIWPLERELSYDYCVKANKRLAYRLGAVQKHADPDLLEVPVPGTFLRAGRSKPVPVRVARLEPEWWTARDVVGALKDPPEQVPFYERNAS